APAGYLFAFGQEISREDYADLFAAIGTSYGPGDGSTTFLLPDYRGRVPVGRDNMGGSAANRVTATTITPNGNTLGAIGGTQTHVLTIAQLAAHAHTGTISGTAASAGAHTHSVTGTAASAGAHTHTVGAGRFFI